MKTEAELELAEFLLGGESNKEYFDILYKHCGVEWEITDSRVTCDDCPQCGGYVDPVFYMPAVDIEDRPGWDDDELELRDEFGRFRPGWEW